MPTFVSLIELRPEHRPEATKNVQERYEAAAAIVESHGGEVVATYYGDIAGYDAMVILEFPDRESFERADIEYSMDPSVETDVFQVRSHEEYAELVERTLGEQAVRPRFFRRARFPSTSRTPDAGRWATPVSTL